MKIRIFNMNFQSLEESEKVKKINVLFLFFQKQLSKMVIDSLREKGKELLTSREQTIKVLVKFPPKPQIIPQQLTRFYVIPILLHLGIAVP